MQGPKVVFLRFCHLDLYVCGGYEGELREQCQECGLDESWLREFYGFYKSKSSKGKIN